MRSKAKNLALDFENEQPAGTVNGVNSVFVLTYFPYSPKAVMMFVDGLALRYGVHFSVNAETKTVTMVNAPGSGQDVIAWYMRKL